MQNEQVTPEEGTKKKLNWDIFLGLLVGNDKQQPIDPTTFTYESEEQTLEFINSFPRIRGYITQWLSKLNEIRPRDTELTNNNRDKGNAFFFESRKPYDLAADYYTRAIFSAPPNSLELSLAHANRAACASHMLAFMKEGYQDCEMALKFNYPKEKLFKVLNRKFILAPDHQSKEKTLHEMEDAVKKGLFTKEKMNLPHLRKEVKKMKKGVDFAVAGPSKPKSSEPAHKNKKIKEEHKSSFGRYIVAGEPIKKNDAIYREKAYAFVPVYGEYAEDTIIYHCQNCAKNNIIPFPCYDCARASYCSIECLDQHKSIHRFECPGYQRNLWMKVGIAQLSIRCFLVGFADSIGKMGDKSTTPRKLVDKLTETKEKNFIYGDVLRLTTNLEKMRPEDLLDYVISAQMIVIYLENYTDFFKTLPKKCLKIMPNIDDWKRYAEIILTKHMAQLVINGHGISSIDLLPPAKCDYSYRNTTKGANGRIKLKHLPLVIEQSRAFTAIFPKISILNHSCDPNIRNHFEGPYLTIHASRDIAQKEEIFNCYGNHYKMVHTDDRQLNLYQQYHFMCTCEKCDSKDLTYDEYYTYICFHCNSVVPIDLPRGFGDAWWNSIMDSEAMENIRPLFQCKHPDCKKPLPLNPITFKAFLTTTNTERQFDYPFFRRTFSTKSAAEFYLNVVCNLSKHHELRTIMAPHFLQYNMEFDYEEVFPFLAYITMDYYTSTRERYGVHAFETILSIPFALYILNMAIELENTKPSTSRDIEKIRKTLDIRKMQKSVVILNKDMQTIFKHAFEDVYNVEEKTEREEQIKQELEELTKLQIGAKKRGTIPVPTLSALTEEEDPDSVD